MDEQKERSFRPRTTLGKRLWDIRARIVASGEKLLDWDEVEQELAKRRGYQSAVLLIGGGNDGYNT